MVGVVTAVDEDGGVVVQYTPNTRWTFNPIALKKISPPSPSAEQPSSPGSQPRLSLQLTGLTPFDGFLPGDFVRVSKQERFVREQQQGHGDWVESMATVRESVCVSVYVHVCMFVCHVDSWAGWEGQEGVSKW